MSAKVAPGPLRVFFNRVQKKAGAGAAAVSYHPQERAYERMVEAWTERPSAPAG
ncbi:hypothetical protein [Azospirillum baldaniorum]|uniref:hypothetical protein n=1 Tax=Azospirillum baldaniorum TaxID=1064539 RepID=UPI00130D6131|nr:hypothetical protein [Azospirillum baldaniorum]